ncbi:hypothetical protein K469DRAFT_116763 [Zopfia rhizophila CBS 207.26]|uniref:Uncharacterized protein n=1 Tax=Zopfia rhizophila CBS 207.26 TaxID=1314779 RepID=A0A6A6E4Q4_9PEZI|nr:hypothetical protein K469DRAFT_116763 [Zopfia rhizophila CBS 207.26]
MVPTMKKKKIFITGELMSCKWAKEQSSLLAGGDRFLPAIGLLRMTFHTAAGPSVGEARALDYVPMLGSSPEFSNFGYSYRLLMRKPWTPFISTALRSLRLLFSSVFVLSLKAFRCLGAYPLDLRLHHLTHRRSLPS